VSDEGIDQAITDAVARANNECRRARQSDPEGHRLVRSDELIAEIPSAVSIDMLIAFVRWSGVQPLLAALPRHVEGAGRIRL
jgi:hypothetical protein